MMIELSTVRHQRGVENSPLMNQTNVHFLLPDTIASAGEHARNKQCNYVILAFTWIKEKIVYLGKIIINLGKNLCSRILDCVYSQKKVESSIAQLEQAKAEFVHRRKEDLQDFTKWWKSYSQELDATTQKLLVLEGIKESYKGSSDDSPEQIAEWAIKVFETYNHPEAIEATRFIWNLEKTIGKLDPLDQIPLFMQTVINHLKTLK